MTHKPPSTKFHPNQVILNFGPPCLISEFKTRIRNQRPQNSLSTKFYPNQSTFCILARHIGSALMNFRIFSIDQRPRKPPRTEYHPDQINFAFSSAILDPQYRIS